MTSTVSALPKVAVIGTGGTIASSAGSETQLRDYKVTNKIGDMLAAVPQLSSVAVFECEQVCNVESHQINDAVLLPLAHRVQAFVDRPDIAGVVITHGTDTLEETAYFLHLVIKTDKPIVLVGAMRPATAMSADGPLNLYHAVVVAAHPDSHGHGVLAVMNDRIASARHVTKGHANAVEAFVPTEFGYLGSVSGQEVRFQNRLCLKHTRTSDLALPTADQTLPMVDVVFDHQGAGMHHYGASIEAGAQGIVLAATGQGSLSPQGTQGVEMARSAGLAVVRASRVWEGAVRYVSKDDKYGLIAAQTLNPQKARILLRLALLKTQDPKAIQRYFDTH